MPHVHCHESTEEGHSRREHLDSVERKRLASQALSERMHESRSHLQPYDCFLLRHSAEGSMSSVASRPCVASPRAPAALLITKRPSDRGPGKKMR